MFDHTIRFEIGDKLNQRFIDLLELIKDSNRIAALTAQMKGHSDVLKKAVEENKPENKTGS